MNHLVFLDARAGELEKILSGVKTMLVKDCDPVQSSPNPIQPGDSLYFLRDQDDRALRVKATVVRTLVITNQEDLSHTLKAMQPRLQLTECQYSHWAARQHVLLVEFESAQKIGRIEVAVEKTADRLDWISFRAWDQIIEAADETANHARPDIVS